MKKISSILLAMIISLVGATSVYAFDWGSMIGGMLQNSSKNQGDSTSNSGSSALGNLLGGMLQNSNLEVKDIAGTWTAKGPAILFKSDDVLQSAGGVAASAYIKEKLMPYYNKLGVDSMKLEIKEDGNVTVTLKSGRTYNGTIKKGEKEGEMVLNFSKVASMANVGNVTVEVTKSMNDLNLMADVSKLQSLLSVFADKINISQLSTITDLLENYDGIYAGLEFSK